MTGLSFPESAPGAAGKRVFVTVGMGRWPFDRLIAALEPICSLHQVAAQIGTSKIAPPCPHQGYVEPSNFDRLLDEADVVITHGGNTVRLAQRRGKVPVVVARLSALGEMANDHQVEYVADEEQMGRVVACWDVSRLAELVSAVPSRAPLGSKLEPPPAASAIRATMHDVEAEIFDDPFAHHPLRRYSYAWRALRGVAGPHLDVGCGDGSFLAGFRASTGRHAVGVDAQHAYLQIARRPPRDLPVARVSHQGLLPFGDRVFSSVTMLDVLEHCEDELALLEEVRRVTRPGGAVVLTVPARFSMAWLDPDDVKYRWPRFHRLVYSARFGRAAFHRRFEDLSDGARGDCAVERSCHQHYDEREIDDLLEKTGFSRVATRRSGLLGNAGAVMAKLLGSRTERILRSCILLDADVFAAANLFVTAVREP